MVKQSRPGGKSHSYSRLFFFLHRAWSKSETFRQVRLFAWSKWQTRPGKTNISLTPGYPFLSTEPGVRVRLFTRLKQQTRPGKNSHRLLQSFLSSLQSLVQEWDFSPGQSGKQDLVKNLTLTPGFSLCRAWCKSETFHQVKAANKTWWRISLLLQSLWRKKETSDSALTLIRGMFVSVLVLTLSIPLQTKSPPVCHLGRPT